MIIVERRREGEIDKRAAQYFSPIYSNLLLSFSYMLPFSVCVLFVPRVDFLFPPTTHSVLGIMIEKLCLVKTA